GDGATATLHAVGSILASSVTAPHDATGTTLNGGTDSITASSMNDIMTQTLGIPTSTTGDPKLGALAQNGGPTETLAPGAGSAAINNGMASGTDERGIARRSGFQDAGAFEAEAATLSVNSGGGQSAPAGAAFTNPIVVEAKDASGNDLGGVVLTLTPPGSGASATFTPPSPVTAANGQAQTNATANGTQGGPYTVNVGALGGASTSFMLTNTVPIVASVTVVQGAGQSATVGTAFSQTIIIFAANGSGAGVSGQTFNLSVPSGGATLSTSQVTTDGTGHASFNATAGTHAPAFYNVLVTGVVSTHFGLVNLGGPPKNILVAAGDKDGTLAGQPFPGAIVLLVTDSFDNPTNAVTPTFTPPSSGATATFSPPLESSIWGFYAFTATASPTAGGPYPVTVTAGSATATFDLVNVAPPSPAPPTPLVSSGGHGSGGCSLGGRAAPSSLSPLLLLLVFVLARRR
ncbi:MAG TPA: choice-of-anchor Q domain-containing protein, partial [Planctomycetota bacterium]|nr:choice-of-anchor Q domain-containing protein [Planctomycetota bacterium]